VNGTPRTFPFNTNVVVTAVGGACGTAAGDNPTVSVTIGGTSTQNGSAPCTAGAWALSLTTPLSATGPYTVTATQTDGVGNTGSSGAQTINLDTSGPVVTITDVNGAPRTFPYSTNAALTSVGGACGNAPGDNATVSIAITGAGTQNGTAPCSGGTWTYTTSPTLSATGTYTVNASQGDATGNRHGDVGQRHASYLPLLDERTGHFGRRRMRSCRR
jgi:hypothetical protein